MGCAVFVGGRRFLFEAVETGICTCALPIPVPDGWACRADRDEDALYFQHCSSARAFWNLDVGVLQVLGAVPGDVDLTAKDFSRACKTHAMLHHPDKVLARGGDSALFTDARERFQRVAEEFSEMHGGPCPYLAALFWVHVRVASCGGCAA